ncbi:MAG TPA: glycosyltransferase [Thermoanaerobaculia bacterium]|nr:glycosyltransferase [Thermoanaerobaculia bacterium]
MPMDRPGEDARRAASSVLAQKTSVPFELIVVAASDPALPHDRRVRVLTMAERNPALRRNAAARAAGGEVLAFIDDDAFADPSWLDRAALYLDEHPGVLALGGPDPAPDDSTPAEMLSETLLATPWIGSGIAAHESRGGIFAVRRPWDVALVNLFVRKDAFDRLGGFDESIGYIGEDTELIGRMMQQGFVIYHEGVVVRHRRRAFPGAYLRQRWRYRVKTGERLVAGRTYRSGRVVAFLLAGCLFLALMVAAPLSALALLTVYLLAVTALAIPVTPLPPARWPLIPIAFLLHHATYWLGLVTGMVRGVWGRGRRGANHG